LSVLQLRQFMSQEREFSDSQIFSKGDTHHGNSNNRRTENQRESCTLRGNGQFHGTGRGSGRNNCTGTRRPWSNDYDNSLHVRCSLAIVEYIQRTSSTSTYIPFRVLFDSGSDNTCIHQDSLPSGATPKVINKRSGQTLAGLLSTSREVDLQKLYFPEFTHACRVNQQHT
jgi:hypothetical protein